MLNQVQYSAVKSNIDMRNRVLPKEDYFLKRNITNPGPVQDIYQDQPDHIQVQVPNPSQIFFVKDQNQNSNFTGRNELEVKPIYLQNNAYNHLPPKNLLSDIKAPVNQNFNTQMNKDSIKDNYEEFIQRLKMENEQLKKSEMALIQIISIKKNLEIDLEQISQQLEVYKNGNNDIALERLKAIIQELNQEKMNLRRLLEHHRVHINEMVTNVTTIHSPNEENSSSAKNQLMLLRSNYDKLMQDYRNEKIRPIQIPENPEIKRILQEKLNQIEGLHSRIRFLDDQLKQKNSEVINISNENNLIKNRIRNSQENQIQQRSQNSSPYNTVTSRYITNTVQNFDHYHPINTNKIARSASVPRYSPGFNSVNKESCTCCTKNCKFTTKCTSKNSFCQNCDLCCRPSNCSSSKFDQNSFCTSSKVINNLTCTKICCNKTNCQQTKGQVAENVVRQAHFKPCTFTQTPLFNHPRSFEENNLIQQTNLQHAPISSGYKNNREMGVTLYSNSPDHKSHVINRGTSPFLPEMNPFLSKNINSPMQIKPMRSSYVTPTFNNNSPYVYGNGGSLPSNLINNRFQGRRSVNSSSHAPLRSDASFTTRRFQTETDFENIANSRIGPVLSSNQTNSLNAEYSLTKNDFRLAPMQMQENNPFMSTEQNNF